MQRRNSVSPVEQVVDSCRDHLDVAISGRENVTACDGESNRNGIADVAQPQVGFQVSLSCTLSPADTSVWVA